jgi:putative colanic acid biosynthesis UDP-glucose lipid carrier transferase
MASAGSSMSNSAARTSPSATEEETLPGATRTGSTATWPQNKKPTTGVEPIKPSADIADGGPGNHRYMHIALQATDLLVLVAAALIAYWLRFRSLDMPIAYQRATLVNVLLAALVFPWAGVYSDWREQSRYAELRALLAGWTMAFAAYAVLGLVLKFSEDYSRLWTALTFGIGCLGLLGVRLCMRRHTQRQLDRNIGRRSAVVIGHGDLAHRVLQRLTAHAVPGIELIGCFGASHDTAGTLHLGELDAAPAFLATRPVHQVWLALPLSAERDITDILHALRNSTADIRLVPDAFSAPLLHAPRQEIAGLPVLNLRSCPLDGPGGTLKHIEDYLLASLILLLLSPLMALLALGVKLSSPGPVLFRQLRHGRDGEIIEVWKFRTMRQHHEPPGHVTQARRNDPRVTRFGAFLRRTSLDELPQLFNVLQGRMSLVGPRPHAVEHNDFYKDHIQHYLYRHHAKPGITGWAQVNGLRGETDTVEKMAARVEHDLYYIQNWSPLLDLRILLMTAKQLWRPKNAY